MGENECIEEPLVLIDTLVLHKNLEQVDIFEVLFGVGALGELGVDVVPKYGSVVTTG